jgi:hypothetical protein
MKKIWLLHLLSLLTIPVLSSQGNPNTMSVMINGKEYQTEPRRIRIGAYGYITGNAVSPDKALRIWLANVDGSDMTASGSYLIVGERDNYRKDDEFNQAWLSGKYKGIAAIRYVEETKSPRMEYHVGDSKFNGESIDVIMGDDGYLNLSFNVTLDGTWWKENATATAFGGLGRLTNKLEDKAVTSASGYDQNIDPEGNGYKKQKLTDTVTLTDGKVRLKMN